MKNETNDNSKNRILWLDGLRGIACILIFVHHFIVAFFPAAYYGNNETSSESVFSVLLAESPLGVIVNGDFWACVFCIVSGLVLSLSILNSNKDNISKIMLKRYPRLALPTLAVSLVVYVMLKMGLFFSMEASLITHSKWFASYYTETVSIKRVLKSSLYGVWLEGDSTFSTAFWMLTPLFIGSYLTYLISIMSRNAKQYIYILYVILIVILTLKNSLLLCFVLGSMLGYTYYRKNSLKNNYALGLISISIGIYFGGFPSEASPLAYYKLLAGKLLETINSSQYYHIVGAFLFIYGILKLRIVQNIFEKKLFLKLGKISFSVYLLHIPILFSITAKIFLVLWNVTGKYAISTLAAFLISGGCLLVVALLFSRYIEGWCTKVTRKITDAIYY